MQVNCTIPEIFSQLFEPHRYKVYYGGRGGAKSWAFAQALLIEGIKRPCRVLCAREIQNSIKDSVKRLLDDTIQRLNLQDFYESTDTEIRGINGSLFIFTGLNMNAEKIKSFEGITHCWVEEAETISERSFDLLVPTIRLEASEIWLSFNPLSEDGVIYKKFVLNTPSIDSVVCKVTFRDNPFFPEVLRKEMEHCLATEPEKYDHVWEGNPKRISEGAYYGKTLVDIEQKGQITQVPYDPALRLFTAWDLGMADSTGIWVAQVYGLQVRILAYYENNNQALNHYADWLHKKQYTTNTTNFLPHDARAKELGTGLSREEVLSKLDIGNIEIIPAQSVADGINAVQTFLARCWFDEEKCQVGLKALRAYHAEYNDKMKTFASAPCHDWSSHAADAFRYLALGMARMSGVTNSNKKAFSPKR